MTTSHKLPAELHEKIYAEIALKYLPRATPQQAPVAIITGGQPGSGKSGITHAAKRELQARGGLVLIDADEVRSWHPEYQTLLRRDDTTAANKTHPDAGAWAGRLGREAIASKRNVIFDQTSKDPAAVVELARKLREAGYHVELRVMAVNPQVSEQRIYMRYESQKAATGHGRFSTKDNHDIAFDGVLKAVAAVEAAQAVDAIKVYDKDHRIVFENRLGPGRVWLQPAQAAARMDAERSRPLTLSERADIHRDYGLLYGLLQAPERAAGADVKANLQRLHDRAGHHYLAEAFRKESTVEARLMDRLSGAKALLAAVEQKARSDGLSKELVAAVVAQARQVLAERIERGDMPVAPTVAREKGQQRPERDRGLER